MSQKGPSLVVVLKDGIRGHENQSLGVAHWLEVAGAEVLSFEVPKLSGLQRFLRLKVGSRALILGSDGVCRKWLEKRDSSSLLEKVGQVFKDRGLSGEDVLFISAGSSAASYCLALARTFGSRCCTIMTPSVLGIEPFDFAVVPEHDRPKAKENVLVTLGAPNKMCPEVLEKGKKELIKRFPPKGIRQWGVLLGGDDKNYRIGPDWAERLMEVLFFCAEKAGAELYITTSRRTSRKTEQTLKRLCEGKSSVRMLLLASEESWSPVPGILGLCEKVLCTEDSVSMISEAATAGLRPIVLSVERKASLGSALGCLVPGDRFLWGTRRFDKMIKAFEDKKLCMVSRSLEELRDLLFKEMEGPEGGFNEAQRAARWILERWKT
jgi:hypothetical protein